MNNTKYDAIVIGSGVAGSIAAKELTERGLHTVLLEAGPFLGEKDFPPSMDAKTLKGVDVLSRMKIALTGQMIQARATYISDENRHLFVNDRENPYTTPLGRYFLWIRGRQLGGRLHTYGRVLLRMSDYDFKAASRDGYGQDWPISYSDLAPYYDRIEEYIGVYGCDDHVPNLPDGHYIKSPILTESEKKFKRNVEAKWPERKVISWRFAGPNLRRVPRGVQSAIDTGLLDLRTNAVAKRLAIDPSSGKATGVVYVDRKSREERSVHGKVVVLCASAIESVRLLLNSACSSHPNGVGNSSGHLGRYFMDQTPSLVVGSVPDSQGWYEDDTVPQDPSRRAVGGIYVPRFQNLDTVTHPDFIRGFGYQGVVGRWFVPDGQPSQFGLMGFGEMLAREENRITLDRRTKDAWGIPAPRIDCTLGENDLKLMKEQLRCVKEMVLDNGFKIDFAGTALGLDEPNTAMRNSSQLMRLFFRYSFGKSLGIGAAIHESGGARMGNDPSNSVVNQHNQCWDADNVFVTDASSFVTAGTVGPSLTIMAITARACEFIASRHSC
ncbi:GMC family oxidoreductase [Consotaella aegiceratis]|uniref:GMC family oxidoreductase n=1 Tax=Consotaella aegiceratis TaxID=3097961 RepID=UPI002F3E714B